jgi:hypothetical protein
MIPGIKEGPVDKILVRDIILVGRSDEIWLGMTCLDSPSRMRVALAPVSGP